MLHKRRVIGSAIVAAVALAAMRDGAHAQARPANADVLERAGEYVRGLVDTLKMVVSDETYRQTDRGGRRRTIQSEMLLWWLPDEHVWLSVRNVRSVDGKPVQDSEQRLQRALAVPPNPALPAPGGTPEDEEQRAAGAVARSARLHRLQEEGARFDLGPIRRTTSNPTLVLQFLAPDNQRHFMFARQRSERVGRETASKFSFVEGERPTVVRVDGKDVVSAGAVWVRDADGAILRTDLALKIGGRTAASITVDFQRDGKLAAWVPSKMVERYGVLTCTSTYSNFRRFETSGRLVDPK